MWSEYFSDSTVIVSGGSTGIGAAVAEGFARAGANTILTDIADESGEQIAELLQSKGHRGVYRHCDVTQEDEVEDFFSWVLNTYGSPSVVHSNAGIEWTKDIRHTSLSEWQRVLDVNLTGTFLVCRAAMRSMCESTSGTIIVTGSPHAMATVPDSGAYAASKGGVHALVRALSLEGAPFGVRVNGIVPGTIDTPMIRREAQASANPESQTERMAASQPLGRLGRPDEVANLALYLASSMAGFMTGSLVSIDGGLTACLPAGPPLSYNS